MYQIQYYLLEFGLQKGCIELIDRALVMIVFLFYRGVIEVDISEYHTASVLINYLDFNFILQGNIKMYYTLKLLIVKFIFIVIMTLIYILRQHSLHWTEFIISRMMSWAWDDGHIIFPVSMHVICYI